MTVGRTSAEEDKSSDENVLAGFGYGQELHRDMSLWTNFALGFAFVSPVVGLYTIFSPSSRAVGASWWWALLIAFIGQTLVALVFAELAAQFPLAGGVYQWSQQLIGPRYAWFSGWAYAWSLLSIFGATAFAGGTFLDRLMGSSGVSRAVLPYAGVVLLVCTVLNLLGSQIMAFIVKVGIAATLLATLGVGAVLLVLFRVHGLDIILPAHVSLQTYDWSSFVEAVAFTGWAFIGFDACGSVAEETRGASRVVPLMIMSSLISVGSVVLLSALAMILAAPTIVLAPGSTGDPILATLVARFGNAVQRPMLATVVIAYFACCLAIQATVSRVLYSLSRDNMLPGARFLKRVSEVRNIPVYAIVFTALMGGLMALWAQGLDVLVLFSTSGLYGAFTLVVGAALFARATGRWRPASPFTLKGFGLPVNVVAFAWLIFETINLGWPRLNNVAWYARYATLLIGAILLVAGATYFFVFRPDRGGHSSTVEG